MNQQACQLVIDDSQCVQLRQQLGQMQYELSGLETSRAQLSEGLDLANAGAAPQIQTERQCKPVYDNVCE